MSPVARIPFMHLTNYAIVAPIQSSMVEPWKDLGKVSIKLHEDGAVHLCIPIPDAVHVVEPSLKPELIFKLSSSLLLFFLNFLIV